MDILGLSYHESAKRNSSVEWIGGIPWRRYGKTLLPLCMPHVPFTVDRTEIRKTLRKKEALLACWTTEWNRGEPSEWWWTCCDTEDYRIEAIDSARGRRSIRQGLRACTVEKIEKSTFYSHSYPIYSMAMTEYGEKPPTQTQYARQVESMAKYHGVEFWGAFYQTRMAAFAICTVQDQAVLLGSTKSAPDLDKHNPNAALFHSISKHYLESGMKYVTNGSRTMWHPTHINEFLETLGFRKVYCRLNVEMSTLARFISLLRVNKWGPLLGTRILMRRKWMQLDGFYRLLRIASTFQ
jgi:hypothetical protein